MHTLLFNYGAAHFAKSLVGLSSVLIFAFFLTEIVGLSPEVMGVIMAASLCFSAVCDAGLGWLLRRRIVSATTAAPIMLFGSILTAISFTAFSGAGLIPKDVQLHYVLITLFMYRFSYTLFDLPHNAMMAFITTDDPERATISAARYITSGLAKIIVAALFASWLSSGFGFDRAHIAFWGCAVFATLGVIGPAMLYWVLVMRPNSDIGVNATEQLKPIDDFKPNSEITDVFPLILASIAIFSCLMASFTKLQAYLVAYALDNGAAGATFIATVALGQIISQVLWAHLAKIMPLHRLYQLTAIGLGVVSTLFLLLAYKGGTILLLIVFAYGGVSSGLLMAIWALQASAAKAGPDMAAQRFGLFVFVSKMAQAASILIIGFLLEQFDFRNDTNSPKLIFIMAAGPIGTALLCSIIGWWISLQQTRPSGPIPFRALKP